MRAAVRHQYPLLVLNLLLSVCVVHVSAECGSEPLDRAFVEVAETNINYYGSCTQTGTDLPPPDRIWGCKLPYTGRACNDVCSTPAPVCTDGQRPMECDAPHMPACVVCREESRESEYGGYSFGAYNPNNQQYELLHGRGSFEYAKLYPSSDVYLSSMFVRDAVTDVTGAVSGPMAADTPSLHRWNDVMFPEEGNPFVWYGAGTIKLQYKTSIWEPGAWHSDVFMKLMPVYSEFTVCGINWGSDVRGILYEFRYRQKVVYDEGMVVYAEIRENAANHDVMSSHSYTLTPTSEWTHNRRLFDYTESAGSSDEVAVVAVGCLRVGFTMRQSREILIDDVRVFANLFSNSGFTNTYFNGVSGHGGEATTKSWTKNRRVEHNGVPGPEITDGYLTIQIGWTISQKVYLQSNHGNGGLLAAVLSIDVRGQGLFVVEYESGTADENNLVTTKIVSKYLKLDDATDPGSQIWQPLRIPVNLDEATSHHSFTIAHLGTKVSETDEIHIDNVILYVDNERCPVKECDDAVGHVFVNGNCEPCVLQGGDELRCTLPSDRVVGCKVGEKNTRVPICAPCPTVEYETGTGGEFVFTDNPLEECAGKCTTFNYWYDRGLATGEPPICTECRPLDTLQCSTGWYASECTGSSNAKCLPCSEGTDHESVLVYTTTDDDTTEQCIQTCIPGQFNYNNNMCFACSGSVCGAEENGFSSLRLLDGLQYTSKCTESYDSQCHVCESIDEAVHFTKNGHVIGDWCGYECIAGTMPCAVCTWDSTNAEQILHVPLYTHTALSTEAQLGGETPFTPTLLVRFTGSVTISTALYRTNLTLVVYVVDADGDMLYTAGGEQGYVLRLFPLVSESTLISMKHTPDVAPITNAVAQPFDATVDMRSFNTASTPSVSDHAVLVFKLVASHNAILFAVNDFVVKSMNVATTDDCDVGIVQAANPKDVTRCRECTHAMGINGPLPGNASWEGPNDCTWQCNQDYELLPGGSGSECAYCPAPRCGTGLYWTSCGVCAPCIPPPANATFTGNGTIRYDNASCPTGCFENFYYQDSSDTCTQCTASSALSCATKQGGFFFELGCSDFEDATCVNCFVCPLGSNASTQCSISADTVCAPCDSNMLHMPAVTKKGGAEWQIGNTSQDYCEWGCAAGLLYNVLNNTCMACDNLECGIGRYPVPCTMENAYVGCASCITPTHAVVLSVGSMSLNSSCRWKCSDDAHYNATLHMCMPNPAVVSRSINTDATATVCNSNICGWGRFIDNANTAVGAVGETPCADKCTACPTLPVVVLGGKETTSAVYTRKGYCDWVCMIPFIQNGKECVSI